MKSEQEDFAEFLKSATGEATLGPVMEAMVSLSEKYAERFAALAWKYFKAYERMGFSTEQAFQLTMQAVSNIGKKA